MELKIVENKEEFDQFVAKHATCHYMKTSMWGEFKQKTEHSSYTLLGFYQEDQLVGTAMVLSASWLGHRYLYIPKGPCIDYTDTNIIDEAMTLLKEYADQENALFLRIDPNVLRMERDLFSNPIEGGLNQEYVTEELKKLGFEHKGYNYAYDGSWTNRYTLIVDLEPNLETVFSKFAKRRKRMMKKNDKLKMTTRISYDQEELSKVIDLQKQLSLQKGFKPNDIQYFKDIMDAFGDHARFYITELDIPQAVEILDADMEKIKESDRANAMKNRDELAALVQTCGEKPTVASGVFIQFGQYTWCWYYYFHKSFNRYSPLDSLHYFAMKDSIDQGIRYYDLCGFGGTVSKDDPQYHLYEYKHEFHPEFIEHIGQFDYIRNPGKMKRYLLEQRAVNKLKRTIHIKRYKK